MFLLFSNSDGLGDPKSLYPSEFILSIPPPRMSTGRSPKFRPSFWQLSPNTKKPRGRTNSFRQTLRVCHLPQRGRLWRNRKLCRCERLPLWGGCRRRRLGEFAPKRKNAPKGGLAATLRGERV